MMGETTSNQLPLPRVALLGTGTMGAGDGPTPARPRLHRNCLESHPGPADALAEHGATASAKPADAVAAAQVVVTMLPNADAVTDVMVRGGALDALHPNATWAQMGTIGVEATELLAAEVARRRPDVAFVDAPVSGSREPARNGRLYPGVRARSIPQRRQHCVRRAWPAHSLARAGRHRQPVEAGAQLLARFLRSRPLPRPAHWPSASAFRTPSLWTRSPAGRWRPPPLGPSWPRWPEATIRPTSHWSGR